MRADEQRQSYLLTHLLLACLLCSIAYGRTIVYWTLWSFSYHSTRTLCL